MIEKRNLTLDFAKGFALIFMIVQHFSVWLWEGYSKSTSVASENPIYFAAISLSAFSAPLFIFCAGSGASFFMEKYRDHKKIVKRGVLLIITGYILNLLITSWFTPASWYVLHLIGFAFITVPLLSVIKSWQRIILFWLIFGLSIVFQTLLNTPYSINSPRMGDLELSLPFLRFAFVEGHFPVLPWLAFFIFGYNGAQDIAQNRYRKLLLQGAILWLIAAIFASMAIFTDLAELNPFISRIVTIRIRFYPVLGPAFLFLTGSVPFLIYIFHFAVKHFGFFSAWMVSIGRISLSVFAAHLFVKQLVYNSDMGGEFSKVFTISVTVAVLVFCVLAERLWSMVYYRFGLEWLIRKFS
ncbi:MAG: DUF1624 domain-containing protein [Spirochaetes bacterium]|nr:DUF1624 domain-containing protein [Spirochaetota bacterium]MBN2771345.1 DUF1624 domain-containing protein [Spirochaetota bacterium]